MRHKNPPVTRVELHNNLLSEEVVIGERIKAVKSDVESKAFLANSHRGGGAFRGSYNHIGGGYKGRASYGRYPNLAMFIRISYGRGYSSPEPDEPVCQICITKGHTADVCTQRLNFTYKGRQPPKNLNAMLATLIFFTQMNGLQTVVPIHI